MQISQKCQYALRAVFELARRADSGPVKIAEIAEAEVIPVRFLEVILSELKQGGFVESRRGAGGGYLLARSPSSITVGELIRFVEGPLGPVACLGGGAEGQCELQGSCVFISMWKRAQKAISKVYYGTTIQDLVDEHRRLREGYVPSYVI